MLISSNVSFIFFKKAHVTYFKQTLCSELEKQRQLRDGLHFPGAFNLVTKIVTCTSQSNVLSKGGVNRTFIRLLLWVACVLSI